MHKILPTILLLLVALVSFAKQSPGGEAQDPFADKVATSYFPGDVLETPYSTEQMITYLQQKLVHLSAAGVTLQLTAHKVSPGGEHFTFDQYYNGIPVFNSQVKINLGTAGKVYSIFDNSYSSNHWNATELVDAAAAISHLQFNELLATQTGYTQANIEEHSTIAEIDGKPAAYKWMQLHDPSTGDFRLYLLDKSGVIIYNRDLNAYSGVPASAYVFNPDPLTTAQTIYAAPYVDSNDANTMVLRDERVLVNIDVTLSGGRYYLENDHFVMTDFSAPNQTVVSSSTPSFLFNRADTAFEEVNAYYHLNTYQAYVSFIGYGSLTQEQIQVDAHALNGVDNSQFSVGGGFPRLFFGDGGVDDAEDADVVVHEYGHALSYAGSPGTNFGQERSALDEGFGDYFAASYSRSLSSYRWQHVFSWDGNNEYWLGRDANTAKVYPAELTASIHRNGEMWATALMQVWSALGQVQADKLALQTLFSLSSNMTFTDAAWAYIQADSAINGGANFDVIFPIMVQRGFINGVGIEKVANSNAPAVELYNSYGFTFNNEPALLINHTGQSASVFVYDIAGRLVLQADDLVGPSHNIDGGLLKPGTYLLKVNVGGATQTFKLIK